MVALLLSDVGNDVSAVLVLFHEWVSARSLTHYSIVTLGPIARNRVEGTLSNESVLRCTVLYLEMKPFAVFSWPTNYNSALATG